MKRKTMKDVANSKDQIAAVVEEFLDWKDVYASSIPDGKMGVVVFAANQFGEAFVEYRLEKDTLKVNDKMAYDDGSEHGLTATVVWIDAES